MEQQPSWPPSEGGPGDTGGMSLLQLMQQQMSMAQQTQQPYQQAQLPHPDLSFVELLQQEQVPMSGGIPQQVPMSGGASLAPLPVPSYTSQPGSTCLEQQHFQLPYTVPPPQMPFAFEFGQQQEPGGMAFGGGGAAGVPVFPLHTAVQQEQQGGLAGASQLPPAILQHQQAAAAAHSPVSVNSSGLTDTMLAAAGAANTGQPAAWPLLQQPAAATAPLLPMMVPTSLALPTSQIIPAPLTVPQPQASGQPSSQPSSSSAGGLAAPPPRRSTAGGTPPAAGAAAAPPPPRRRGRQPKDPSLLTEKQLRAREAQKRFREKQRNGMAEQEAAVGAAAAELDRMRVANESQKLKNEVLEGLLQYKEAQVNALELQKQMDPPPRFVVSPEMVDMMRREGIAGLFTPDVLLRYSVAGYTEHMDERGEVRDPPPFEKVAEDWRDIVETVKSILDAARLGGGGVEGPAAGSGRDSVAATSAGGHSSGATSPHSGGSSQQQQQSGSQHSSQHSGQQQQLQQQQGSGQRSDSGGHRGGQQHQSAAAAAAAAAAGGRGSGGGEGSGGMGSGGRSGSASTSGKAGGGDGKEEADGSVSECAVSSDAPHSPEHIIKGLNPTFVAIAEQASDAVLEVAEAKSDPIARFVLARILSQTAAHSHLQWDSLVDGALVEDGPCSYRFTGHQLRALANLMRRVGLMLWQQALLFPSHITKLGTLRLDEPGNLRVEEQDLDHWRHIVRKLHCRPEQLQKIVAGHQRYMDRMRPVLQERQQAVAEVQRMTLYQMQNMFGTTGQSTQGFVQCTTRLTEATGLVMQTVSAQHAAYCELLIAVIYALTFPVQRPMLFVLSWPYFPQLELIGQAAAQELGQDISGYPSFAAEVEAMLT